MAKEKTMAAGEFKAKCLKVMEQVRDTGVEVVITKHGRPVAKLVPVHDAGPIVGRCKGMTIYEGDIMAPLDVDWEGSLEPPGVDYGPPPTRKKR